MWASLDELLHQILMIGAELVPETSIFNQLTQLTAREYLINYKALNDRLISE
jgi:hypothetical protein